MKRRRAWMFGPRLCYFGADGYIHSFPIGPWFRAWACVRAFLDPPKVKQ